MKHAFLAALAGASILAAGGAQAADAGSVEAMLKKNVCAACHSNDKKMVGPAYKEVANKYRGQKDAEAKLAEKVKKGGAGVWGPVPMPPNPTISDADIKTMVQYILSLK
jgi:cytochrome c